MTATTALHAEPATLPPSPAAPPLGTQALREGFRRARAGGPVRHRDAAAALGASEGELIAAHVGAPAGGLVAHRLVPRWPSIVAALPPVGEVMALTRNASCVHEKTGRYEDVQVGTDDHAAMGLVLGPDIDLRLFFRRWAHGFAVQETFADAARPPTHSLQFFDGAGTAVHKVFARPQTALQAWQSLVSRFASEDATPGLVPLPATAAPAPRPDADVDTAALRQDWAALRDTHEFFPLLKKHGVARTQALRLAEPRFAMPLDAGSARELLRGAAGSGTPIMVFVGNPGTIQIHTGVVRRVEVLGPWLNVLDPGFNLHLREDHIAQAWLVRKPTSDGLVTSLELFDASGETIAMFFGERKPGRTELCSWRRLTDHLAADPAWARENDACGAC